MIITLVLLLMTVLLVGAVVVLLGLGGTIFTFFSVDIIVAVGIIWLIVHFVRKKKKSK